MRIEEIKKGRTREVAWKYATSTSTTTTAITINTPRPARDKQLEASETFIIITSLSTLHPEKQPKAQL